ncbi:MFS transporter [Bordetella genomosp. 12]|uniref:MFS transporter n=1 Tax=Bordetella genomosp. 12 TaxID=463035 RepID=A0A261VUE1_9BORD|nr:MFS transporter [Bordetella genomosp. 12]OZI77726.1 MFS transporter [Bordetella genomosp. 12]
MTSESPALASAVRKASIRLLPFLMLMYVMAFLDRANVGFAKQALQADTGISNAAFAFGAGIFFIGYAIFELPSNLILARVGAKAWLCRIMVSWGVVATAMMFASNEPTFYILRFLLGAAEAGFFPGIILYLTYWFPERHRARAIGVFYFAIPVSLTFGSVLSGYLLDLDGLASMAGWKWMFMVQGLLTVAVGIWAYFHLDNRPAEASWLTAAEKRDLQARLDSEDQRKSAHGAATTLKSVFNKTVVLLTVVFFFVQIAVYGLIFSFPSIISQMMGEKIGLRVGLVAAVPWIIAMIATYYVTRWSDRSGVRKPLIVGMYLALGISLAVSTAVTPVMGFIALCVAAIGYFCATPILWTHITLQLRGTAAAGGIALINSLGNLGGFVAPNLKTWAEASSGLPSLGMGVMGVTALLSALVLLSVGRKRAVAA